MLTITDITIQLAYTMDDLKHYKELSYDNGDIYVGYVERGDYEANLYIRQNLEPHWLREGKRVVTGYAFIVEYTTPVHGLSGGYYNHLHEAIGAACGYFATLDV